MFEGIQIMEVWDETNNVYICSLPITMNGEDIFRYVNSRYRGGITNISWSRGRWNVRF
jgi:hypothetical protein